MSTNIQLEHLVLSPFREITLKAKAALANAETTANNNDAKVRAMGRAAKSLLTKSERALGKIEPICDRLLGEYGVVFVDAVKESEEIAKYKEQLDEMLWDFDDYLEADSFEAEIYDQLMALVRTAALKIADVLIRMKLERPSVVTPAAEEVVNNDECAVMEAKSGPVETWEEVAAWDPKSEDVSSADDAITTVVVSAPEPVEDFRPEDIPPEPDVNPWETTEPVPELEPVEGLERRPLVDIKGEPDLDLVSPLTPTDETKLILSEELQVVDCSSPADSTAIQAFLSNPKAGSIKPAIHSPVFPAEDDLVSPMDETDPDPSLTRFSRPSSRPVEQSMAPNSHWSPTSSTLSVVTTTSQSPVHPPPSLFTQQPGLEVVNTMRADGLIPVTSETTHENSLPLDCNIDSSSSFAQYKGFCEGATEALRSGTFGTKKNRKGTPAVAKCKHCMYELDWRLVDVDLNRFDDANYTSSSITFRLRFLAKSHLPTKRPDDRLFACHFCVHTGRTPHVSDATVFFSQKHLLAHLARHPRPLPPVPSLAVLTTADNIPSHLTNNFDLLFPALTTQHPPSDLPDSKALSTLPCAIATQTFRMTQAGLRLPPDRAHVLQFAAGQKIVGVEFPARYGGEWAEGWVEGGKGVFPVEGVRLVAPRGRVGVGNEGREGGEGDSGIWAVARWKSAAAGEKGKGEGERWLKFAAGEVITGIRFPYQDHWCWSGRNAKGKWGIFPQAFIEPNSLRGPSDQDVSAEAVSGFARTWRGRKGRNGGAIGGSGSNSGVDEGRRRASRASYY